MGPEIIEMDGQLVFDPDEHLVYDPEYDGQVWRWNLPYAWLVLTRDGCDADKDQFITLFLGDQDYVVT